MNTLERRNATVQGAGSRNTDTKKQQLAAHTLEREITHLSLLRTFPQTELDEDVTLLENGDFVTPCEQKPLAMMQ